MFSSKSKYATCAVRNSSGFLFSFVSPKEQLYLPAAFLFVDSPVPRLSIRPTIARLYRSGRPTTIRWLVVSTWVYPIKSRTFWRTAHVLQKNFVRLPFFTHFDVLVSLKVSTATSSHTLPDIILSRLVGFTVSFCWHYTSQKIGSAITAPG
jgi:hypothetical protein